MIESSFRHTTCNLPALSRKTTVKYTTAAFQVGPAVPAQTSLPLPYSAKSTLTHRRAYTLIVPHPSLEAAAVHDDDSASRIYALVLYLASRHLDPVGR